jgi:hypothetical protein
LINKTNRAAACLVEYVNKTGETGKKFNTLKELKKFMADEAEKQKRNMMEKVVKTTKKKSTMMKLWVACVLPKKDG